VSEHEVRANHESSAVKRLPWASRDAIVWVAAAGLGLAGALLGFSGAGRQVTVSDQVTYANLAVAGLIVLGAANAMWLFAGRRAVSRRRRRLLDGDLRSGGRGRSPARADRPRNGALVATTAMSRYHRPHCLMTVGKPASEASLRDHERAGRTPCEVCNP
jgi:hypothetical protein